MLEAPLLVTAMHLLTGSKWDSTRRYGGEDPADPSSDYRKKRAWRGRHRRAICCIT